MDTLRSIMTPDVVQSVPGKSKVSGDHKGVDDVLGYYGTLFEMTGGTLKADLQSAKEEGADKVVALHHLTASYHVTLCAGWFAALPCAPKSKL